MAAITHITPSPYFFTKAIPEELAAVKPNTTSVAAQYFARGTLSSRAINHLLFAP